MSGTKQFVEQRIMKRRAQEAKEMDLRRRLTEYNILAGHGKSEMRVDDMRRARCEAAVRRELLMDYTYVKAEQERERRAQITQLEENLADELARRKAQQMREEMDRRRICDGSEELRALKERLHMAKVNKERAQQLYDLEIRKQRDRLVEHKMAEHMENDRLDQIELEHKLSIEKAKQRERVKVINQQQIAVKESQRQEAMAEYLKEKEQVEALVNKIAQEDAEEQAARQQKQEETRVLLRKFVIEQKAKQEAMERAEVEENERIEQYARDKREREERAAQEKADAEKEKQRILKAMIGQMEAKSKEADDFEQLRNDLHLEEREAEVRRREELMVRKRLEDKEEMRNAYAVQMRMKEARARARQEEEDKIRQELLQKFAEDDRIEQMNEQKRRMRVEQHKREAQRLIELRREAYEKAREQEREADAKLREEEKRRQVVVEEERRRLLQEYAADLRDFLPKHTLETREDLSLLGLA